VNDRNKVESNSFAIMMSTVIDGVVSGLQNAAAVTLLDLNLPNAIFSEPELQHYHSKQDAVMPKLPEGSYLHSVDDISSGKIGILYGNTPDTTVQTTVELRYDVQPYLSLELDDESRHPSTRETNRQAIGGPSRSCP
jgi:hypothetical protein